MIFENRGTGRNGVEEEAWRYLSQVHSRKNNRLKLSLIERQAART